MSTKICTKCNLERPLTEYRWQSKSKGIYQRWCKPCAKAVEKEYWKDPEYRSRRESEKQLRRERNREFVKSIRKSLVCEECGFDDPRAIHFDHLDRTTKFQSVADISSGSYSIETIQKEIAKCRPLCANCHSIRTYLQRGYSSVD